MHDLLPASSPFRHAHHPVDCAVNSSFPTSNTPQQQKTLRMSHPPNFRDYYSEISSLETGISLYEDFMSGDPWMASFSDSVDCG